MKWVHFHARLSSGDQRKKKKKKKFAYLCPARSQTWQKYQFSVSKQITVLKVKNPKLHVYMRDLLCCCRVSRCSNIFPHRIPDNFPPNFPLFSLPRFLLGLACFLRFPRLSSAIMLGLSARCGNDNNGEGREKKEKGEKIKTTQVVPGSGACVASWGWLVFEASPSVTAGRADPDGTPGWRRTDAEVMSAAEAGPEVRLWHQDYTFLQGWNTRPEKRKGCLAVFLGLGFLYL